MMNLLKWRFDYKDVNFTKQYSLTQITYAGDYTTIWQKILWRYKNLRNKIAEKMNLPKLWNKWNKTGA